MPTCCYSNLDRCHSNSCTFIPWHTNNYVFDSRCLPWHCSASSEVLGDGKTPKFINYPPAVWVFSRSCWKSSYHYAGSLNSKAMGVCVTVVVSAMIARSTSVFTMGNLDFKKYKEKCSFFFPQQQLYQSESGSNTHPQLRSAVWKYNRHVLPGVNSVRPRQNFEHTHAVVLQYQKSRKNTFV